ncbi:MAG: hypothetical protein NZL88_11620, partial [Gaiellaceae bacterium]|nr:hypothetical protein [Gaiellaceae bacterium]
LEEPGPAREELHGHLLAVADGGEAGPVCAEAARRALLSVLRDGDRPELLLALDRELLGVRRRTRPAPTARLAS